MHEVLKVPYKYFGFRPADPGWGQNRSRGPLLQKLLLQTVRLKQQTECIAMIYKYVKKCCYFWFHSDVKFFTRFLCLFGLFALF